MSRKQGERRIFVIGSFDERFQARFNKGAPDECWNWIGAVNTLHRHKPGYGTFAVRENGRTRNLIATRIALELDGRQRPGDDMFALHSCDNSLCVNPRHLRWGTRKENMEDAKKRGRLSTKARREAALA